jgi:DNA polymerase
MRCWVDLETYNEVKDIKAGVYEYARTAEIMLVAYALDDGPVQLWDRTQDDIPRDLQGAIEDPTTKYTAHNAQFDRVVLKESGLFPDHVGGDPKNWDCTMVKAMLHGFTGSLDKLCDIFGLDNDEAKLKDGKKLINRFCKPAPKNHKADRYTAETHPEDWQRFCKYAVRDVEAMRKIAARLPSWNWCPKEYHLDQVINDRGFQVDTELVSAGVKAAAAEKINLAERFVKLANGDVASPTQRAKFLEYLNDQFDLGLENTQKATLEPLLKSGGLDPRAEALIEIALMANKTSTAKYAALEPAVSPDDRFRGGLQFSGAQRTRRWAGRIVQPQNFPSKDLPKSKSIDIYIDALKAGVHDTLFDGELMRYGSAALRGVLIVPEGKKLCVSDLANIEGRANAWLAGEDWKLKAFLAYDTFKLDENGQKIPDGKGDFERMGPDLYKVAAGKILGKKPDAVTGGERNSFGKVTELALGYQGGVGAIQNFATAMGVAFANHWGAIQESVEQDTIDRAYLNWDSWGEERAQDTPKEEWIASEVVKLSWRGSHPRIEKLWHACENNAYSALRNPGQVFKAGKYLHFKYVRYSGCNYLLMKMPGDKFLIYFGPTLNEEGKISYWGVDAITKQWSRQHIYSGKFVENACQSLSRDILMQGIFAAEARGYKPVLTVHDELVTECPDTDEYSEEGLSQILSTPLNWCPGFPLAAEGFEAYRYRK